MLFLSALINPNQEHNCSNVINRLLEVLEINVTGFRIKQILEEHPDYPSLLSISDTLIQLKIENISLKTEAEKLREFPLPVIVQMHEFSTPYFSVIKSWENDGLVLSDIHKSGWKGMNWDDFGKAWKGIVMLVESQEDAGEPDFKIKRIKSYLSRSIPLLIIGLTLGWFLQHNVRLFDQNGWHLLIPLILLCLKVIGCYIGALFLWYEIDKNNASLQKVCSGAKNLNCHAILQSPTATLFSVISWGEIGFVYFTGGLITLLIAGFNALPLNLLAWLNVLTLPYTVFSVYYQWRIAKQWCPLCLAVQALLIAECTVNIAGSAFQNIMPVDFYELVKYLLFFLLPALGWFLIKPYLLLAKDSKRNKLDLIRMKHNTEIFESLLSRQRAIIQNTSGLGITLGNPQPKTKLIKVCNPYCGPCAKAHPDVEELLHYNPDLQVQIIFTASNTEGDIRSAPVKHLLAIAEKNDELLTKQALNDWYSAPVKDYDKFASKYKMNGELQKQGNKMNAMTAWCRDTGITHTPTFFIQGHELPQMYNINDLKYFIQQ
jgi:uncharacterized membrane protein